MRYVFLAKCVGQRFRQTCSQAHLVTLVPNLGILVAKVKFFKLGH
jgi:hypothetical protein